MANRKAAAKKAAQTRKHRAAGKKAAKTRKLRAAGKKAARTRKLRVAGKKAALTKKRRSAARKAAATRKLKKEQGAFAPPTPQPEAQVVTQPGIGNVPQPPSESRARNEQHDLPGTTEMT
jgi:hypothetical protein